MVYLISLGALRLLDGGDITFHHEAIIRDATSEEEAIEIGVLFLEEEIPSAEGWSNYDVKIKELNLEHIHDLLINARSSAD